MSGKKNLNLISRASMENQNINKKIILTLLVVVFGFALFVALYHLQDSPRTWFDEGIYIDIARTLTEKGIYGFQTAPHMYGDVSYISVGYPVLFPLALLFTFLPQTLLVARLFAILWVFALLIVSFLYIKERRGIVSALVALCLLATFSPLYGNGKNVLGEIPGLVFLVASLWMYARAQAHNWTKVPLMLAGFFAGLAGATKPTFLPFLALFGLVGIVTLLRRKIPLRLFLLCTSMAVLPIIVWVITQFSSDTSWTGIFSHYANPYNEINPWVNSMTNLKRFVTEATPIHFAFLFIISSSFLGMFLKKVSTGEWVLYLYSVSIIISFLKSPGWYRYFFPAHLLMFILISSLMSLYEWSNLRKKKLTALVIALVLFQGHYTISHIDQMYYPPWRTVRDTILSFEGTILFYNVPEGAFFSQKDDYYQVLTIREGLSYGEDNLEHLTGIDMIITRDSDKDLGVIKNKASLFKETAHIGNYYVFQK